MIGVDYPEQVRTWVLGALVAGPLTVSDLSWRTGARLRWLLLVLRDMQQADEVRLTTAGRYRRTHGRVGA